MARNSDDLAARRAMLEDYRRALALHRYAIGEALQGQPWPPSDDTLAERMRATTDDEVRAAIRTDRYIAAGRI